MNDNSKGAPICRWIYKGILVDIMPANSAVLGFSNKWYIEGIQNKISIRIFEEIDVFIFPAEYYLATKFEAHKGRGGNDLRQSHDFEDIIFVLNNCNNLLTNILDSNQSVKNYLKEEFANLLKNKALVEGVESALPYGSSTESTEIILGIISEIAFS